VHDDVEAGAGEDARRGEPVRAGADDDRSSHSVSMMYSPP
jgi:hypothetical protein